MLRRMFSYPGPYLRGHPFEGVIPEGNYGAGTVIVWDIGEYILEKSTLTKYSTREHLEEIPEVLDLSELEKKYGKITFVLYGQKLKGKFSLVKTRTKNQWLLIKLKDDFACSSNSKDKNSENDITESRPESVLTGKKNKDLCLLFHLNYKFNFQYHDNYLKFKNPRTRTLS